MQLKYENEIKQRKKKKIKYKETKINSTSNFKNFKL